jgi:hypothetical protein
MSYGGRARNASISSGVCRTSGGERGPVDATAVCQFSGSPAARLLGIAARGGAMNDQRALGGGVGSSRSYAKWPIWWG